MKERYESLRGEGNPMRREEVAKKQAESLRATWADPKRRKELMKSRYVWSDEKKAAFAEKVKQQYAEGRRPAGVKWSEERKQAQREKMRVYWDNVKAALALMDNQQHADKDSTS